MITHFPPRYYVFFFLYVCTLVFQNNRDLTLRPVIYLWMSRWRGPIPWYHSSIIQLHPSQMLFNQLCSNHSCIQT